jgi:hypothetical protein
MPPGDNLISLAAPSMPNDQCLDGCGTGLDTMVASGQRQSLQQQQVVGEDDEALMEARDKVRRDALADILRVLKSQERLYGRSNDSDGLHPYLHDSWRPVMVSWMFSVIDAFSLMPEIVTTAIYYLDACGPTIPKEDYPLMAMAALNVAVKCHETKMFPLDQLVELMGGTSSSSGGKRAQHRYVPEDVIEMERTILRASQWKLHPPTAHEFLNQFVEVLPDECDEKANVLTQGVSHLKNAYMWEHVLHQQQSPQPSSFPPSTMAYAALLLALEGSSLLLMEKQMVCQSLLEVADISAHTSNLTEAYNWLAFSKSLQEQLVINQQMQRLGGSTVPAPTTPQQSHPRPPPAIIEPEEDETMVLVPTMQDPVHAMVNTDDIDLLDEPPFAATNDSNDEALGGQPAQQDDYDEVDTPSEVIFFSQTYLGDGFEVLVSDSEAGEVHHLISLVVEEGNVGASVDVYDEHDEDDISADEDGLASWDEDELVLTESLDEDGFEVSYADDWKNLVNNTTKNNEDLLAGLVASPRIVTL